MLSFLYNDRSKSRPRRSILSIVAALSGCCAALSPNHVIADNVSFSTNLTGEQFFQSDGSALNNTFKFQLGVFADLTPGNPFVPTGSNTSLWEDFWKVFDEANEANAGYNVINNAVLSFVQLNEDGTSASPSAAAGYDFFDKKPYVWAFNDKDGDTDSEWALYTKSSWAFPASSTNGNPTTHHYTLADADTAVFGGINDTSSATGSRTSFPAEFSIQTHAVPEPSTGLLLLIAASFASLTRKQSIRN